MQDIDEIVGIEQNKEADFFKVMNIRKDIKRLKKLCLKEDEEALWKRYLREMEDKVREQTKIELYWKNRGESVYEVDATTEEENPEETFNYLEFEGEDNEISSGFIEDEEVEDEEDFTAIIFASLEDD